MEKKLRIGWVGAGFVGQVAHLSSYIEIPEIDIVGLAELRPNLGELACAKYNIPKLYDDHLSLLEDGDLDAVVAIVRREHTASVALDVLTKGIPLFTEKPMAPTLEQGAMLVRQANKNRCLYSTGFMRRHDEGVQIAKALLDELVATNELGDVLFFRCYCFGGGDYCNITGYTKTSEPQPRHLILPIAPDWLPKSFENEYERFSNVFVHDINLMRYLVDRTPLVTHVDYRKFSGSVSFDFGNYPGVFEFAHLDTTRSWQEGVEIVFETGRLVLELTPAFLRNQPACVKVYKEKNNGTTEMINPRGDWTWAFKRQAQAFVNNLLHGTNSLASGADGLEDLRLVEKIWAKICNLED